MQIFSKLQRNSNDKIFVKLIIIYFINFLSSFSPFFPILVGVFILCDTFLSSLVFALFFCYFHNYSLWMVLIFISFKLFVINSLKDIIDFQYQDAVALIVLYLLFVIYLIIFSNVLKSVLVLYVVYNYAFDLIVMRFFKCELNSY